MEEYTDEMCRNRTEGEQESVDEKWKELVKLTTTSAEKVVGRSSAK